MRNDSEAADVESFLIRKRYSNPTFDRSSIMYSTIAFPTGRINGKHIRLLVLFCLKVIVSFVQLMLTRFRLITSVALIHEVRLINIIVLSLFRSSHLR